MSNRTLLEINHDFGAQIERDPELFVREIVRLLKSGKPQPFLDHFGVSVGPTRHHSEPAPFVPRKLEPRND